MKFNLQNLWHQVFEQIKLSWQPLLITHLLFTALGFAVFAPLIGFTSQLLLKLSGQNALADQDIAYFLLSPVGLVALVVFSALFIAILSFEQAAMMYIVFTRIKQPSVSPLDALRSTTRRAHRLWMFTTRLVIRILIIVLPIAALAAAISWYLISDYDINFYLTEKPREFLIAAGLIGLLLLAMVIILAGKLIQWSMSLPLILFTDTTPAASFSESARLIHNHKFTLLSALISWAAMVLLTSFIALGLLKLIGHWAIPMVSTSLTPTLLLLGGLAALWALANFVITTLSSAAFASLITTVYTHLATDTRTNFKTAPQTARSTPSRQLSPRGIVAAGLATILIAGLAGAWLINDIPTVNQTLIVAHRGAAGKAPENTLASFQQAIDDKADWVEFDVQENAEGNIIVTHDSDFMKLAANPVKAWDTTGAMLDDIDIGSWFDASFSAERVPTLEQVLTLARGKVKAVIELKYYGHDQQLEQRVIDIVEQAGMVDEVAIMSLKYPGIQKVRALRPQWNIGLLSATAIGDLSQLDTDFLAVAMGMVSPGFINRAHQAGRKVFVWTINDRISMSRMISLGVDGIITDEPELARQVLAERADLSTVERLLMHTAQLFGEPYVPKQYRDNSP